MHSCRRLIGVLLCLTTSGCAVLFSGPVGNATIHLSTDGRPASASDGVVTTVTEYPSRAVKRFTGSPITLPLRRGSHYDIVAEGPDGLKDSQFVRETVNPWMFGDGALIVLGIIGGLVYDTVTHRPGTAYGGAAMPFIALPIVLWGIDMATGFGSMPSPRELSLNLHLPEHRVAWQSDLLDVARFDGAGGKPRVISTEVRSLSATRTTAFTDGQLGTFWLLNGDHLTLQLATMSGTVPGTIRWGEASFTDRDGTTHRLEPVGPQPSEAATWPLALCDQPTRKGTAAVPAEPETALTTSYRRFLLPVPPLPPVTALAVARNQYVGRTMTVTLPITIANERRTYRFRLRIRDVVLKP